MMSRLPVTLLFVFAVMTNVAVADNVQCWSTPDDARREVGQANSPFGFWKGEPGTLYIFADTVNESLGLVADLQQSEITAFFSVELCKHGSRFLARYADGYYEFKITNGRLMIGKTEYRPDKPGNPKFEIFQPATLVVQ